VAGSRRVDTGTGRGRGALPPAWGVLHDSS